MSLRDEELPRLEDILLFVERRALSMPSSSSTNASSKDDQTFKRRTSQRSIKSNVAATGTTPKQTQPRPQMVNLPTTQVCLQCAGTHRINKCMIFRNMNIDQRWQAVHRLGVCFNCLQYGHSKDNCSAGNCILCHNRHNTLLCRTDSTTGAAASSSQHSQQSTQATQQQTSTQQSTGVNAPPQNYRSA